jgi:hypothetical protein
MFRLFRDIVRTSYVPMHMRTMDQAKPAERAEHRRKSLKHNGLPVPSEHKNSGTRGTP